MLAVMLNGTIFSTTRARSNNGRRLTTNRLTFSPRDRVGVPSVPWKLRYFGSEVRLESHKVVQ